MIVAYDYEARSRQAFIDEAMQKEISERERVAGKVRDLTAELKVYKQSSDDLGKHLHRVELEKKKSEAKVAELEALIATREKDHEEAIASARRLAVAGVQAQMGRAYELLHKMRKPAKRAYHLGQAEANLQLLDDMENVEEPFDPKEERRLLAESIEKFGDAHAVYDEMAAELKQILGKDYTLLVNAEDIVVSPRIEIVAKSVGITAASGSNDGSMGLRLRDASEDSSGSESGEMEKSHAPITTVPTERRELATLEEEPQTGELPSSAVADAPIEGEEGELVV